MIRKFRALHFFSLRLIQVVFNIGGSIVWAINIFTNKIQNTKAFMKNRTNSYDMCIIHEVANYVSNYESFVIS